MKINEGKGLYIPICEVSLDCIHLVPLKLRHTCPEELYDHHQLLSLSLI